MTQDNRAANPTPDPLPPTPAKAAAPPRLKRHWLRWLLIGVGGLIVLLFLLLALVPTIASSGMVRTKVVAAINENINGKVEITNWSIGWTGGVRADGINVKDDAGRQILQIEHVSTQLSLIDAIGGKYHLGKTVVDGLDFNAERYPDGTLNFAHLSKPAKADSTPPANAPGGSPATAAKPTKTDSASPERTASGRTQSAPTKIPSFDGEFQITNSRGTLQTDSIDPVTGFAHQDMVKFTSIEGDVKIPDINKPITDSLKIVATNGGPMSGTLTIDGSLAVIQNNTLIDFENDLDKVNVSQKLGIAGFDLASIHALLPPDLSTLSGRTDGTFFDHPVGRAGGGP